MPCNCRNSFCPECMEGYVPTPAPEIGTARWKNDMAAQIAINNGFLDKKSCIYKLPNCLGYDLGYFAIFYSPGNGYDYFRVDDITEPPQ